MKRRCRYVAGSETDSGWQNQKILRFKISTDIKRPNGHENVPFKMAVAQVLSVEAVDEHDEDDFGTSSLADDDDKEGGGSDDDSDEEDAVIAALLAAKAGKGSGLGMGKGSTGSAALGGTPAASDEAAKKAAWLNDDVDDDADADDDEKGSRTAPPPAAPLPPPPPTSPTPPPPHITAPSQVLSRTGAETLEMTAEERDARNKLLLGKMLDLQQPEVTDRMLQVRGLPRFLKLAPVFASAGVTPKS